MRQTKRMFIAAQLPDTFIKELSAAAQTLERTIPARYVRRENYHITLAFLGETELRLTEAIAAAIDTAVSAYGTPETGVQLGGLGFFGKPQSAILWCGIESRYPLQAVGARLREELASAGVGFDPKPMRPHITLARKADVTGVALADHAPKKIAGRLPAISLYTSERINGVLTYTPVYSKFI